MSDRYVDRLITKSKTISIKNHRVLRKASACNWAFHSRLFKVGASKMAFRILFPKWVLQMGVSDLAFQRGRFKLAFQIGRF